MRAMTVIESLVEFKKVDKPDSSKSKGKGVGDWDQDKAKAKSKEKQPKKGSEKAIIPPMEVLQGGGQEGTRTISVLPM